MKKFLLCAVLLLSFTPSCKHTTPAPTPPSTGTPPVVVTDPATIAKNSDLIRLSTTEAISLGLSLYAKSNPQLAGVIATKMQGIDAALLAYLNGSSGASAAAVNAFLNGQFVDLPPEIRNIIALAASLLDNYLPAPSADALLGAAQYAYIKAFVQGLTDGSAQFLGGVTPKNTKALTHKKAGKWLNGK